VKAVVFGVLIVVALAIFALTRPETPEDRPALPLTVAPPQPPQSPDSTDPAVLDAQLAYNSLTWIQNDLPSLELSSSQENLFQNTLAEIYTKTCDPGSFAPDLAVRKLDICLKAIGKLSEIPNVRLARLLLLQAAGEKNEVERGMEDPAFTTPGTDNLAYRVSLLCRLHAADKAEDLLDRTLETSSLSARKRSETLIRRADVRVQLGKFAETRTDATEALDATGQDSALRADLQMKLLKLESDYPAYAAYLKANPGK
jgi:hypothetical protein